MARTQCIFIGDEIATGLYNTTKTYYPGLVTTLMNIKTEEDLYDSGHLNYDFNNWNWNNDLNVRLAPWYVISTGTWDLNQDQFANMRAVRNQIKNARSGSGLPAPKVIWIHPGVGPNYDCYIYKGDFSKSGFAKLAGQYGDRVTTQLRDISSMLMPSTFFPNIEANPITWLYRSMGYTTFPHGAPFSSVLSNDGNYTISDIVKYSWARNWYTTKYGSTVADQLFTYANTLNNAPASALKNSMLAMVVSSHWSYWYNQIQYQAMTYPYKQNANGWNYLTWLQWNQYAYTSLYCNLDRRHPTSAGFREMMYTCLRYSANFTG